MSDVKFIITADSTGAIKSIKGLEGKSEPDN